jgi:thioredoxin 1
MAAAINDDNFEQEVLQSGRPVLVDFWAEWCGPCKMLGPIIDELAEEFEDVKIVKMNIDHNPKTPSALGIRGIPAMVLFKNGKQVGAKVGLLPKTSIAEWIKSFVF